MSEIRLTALSDSLAKTYGCITFEGNEGPAFNGTDGEINLVCGQCNNLVAANLNGPIPFENCAIRCTECDTAVHLARPSRYSHPVTMKRSLAKIDPPADRFRTAQLHIGTPFESAVSKLSSSLLTEFENQQGTRPRTFYHYTTPDGLRGIVSGGTLWATDIAYLNDSSELDYSVKMINKELEDQALDASPAVSELLRRVNNPVTPTDSSTGYCVICFCTEGDLLSQWRAYGDSGKGFALGVDAYELGGDQLRVRRVIYDQRIQQRLIHKTVAKFISLFEKTSQERSIEELDTAMVLPAFSGIMSSHLAEFAFTFKHPAFSSENEWRAIFEFRRDQHLSLLQFRNSDNLVIPYINAMFGESPNLDGPQTKPPIPLLEIIQGPSAHPNLNLKAVHLLLERFGYEHVEVVCSETPLRTSL